MASKKILGLTVQIGASTTKLDKALADIKKESKQLTDDLKTVNQQLKFDPKNADLQAQKMQLLAKSVQNTEKRAEAYRQAQQAVNKAVAEGQVTTAQAEKALDEFNDEIRKAGNESKRTKAEFNGMADSAADVGKEMDSAGKSAFTMGKLIKGNLISSAVIGGLKLVGSTIKSIGSALWSGAKAAAQWTINFGKAAIESGAAMRETLGTTERVFGGDILSQTLDPWAKQGYKTMGLSRTSALDLANQAGNLLVNKGLTEQEAAEMAKQLVQRSADIGANYNMSTGDAMSYFLSMLKGNYNSADSIGIVTNASAVNALAMQNKLQDVDTSQIIGYEAALEDQRKAQEKLNKAIATYGSGSEQADKANEELTKSSDKLQKMLKAYVGELTDADKALAAVQIGLEQTAKAQGTYEEEAKGWNGLKKTLTAGLENFRDDIGNALLPAAESMLSTFSTYLQGENGQRLLGNITEFLGNISQSAADWINSGGLDDFSDGVETVIGKIAEVLSPENEKKIETWVKEKLPAAIETAQTALNGFMEFCNRLSGVFDWLDKQTEVAKAGEDAYQQAKTDGKSEWQANNAKDKARAQKLAEQAGVKYVDPQDKYAETWSQRGAINLGNDPLNTNFNLASELPSNVKQVEALKTQVSSKLESAGKTINKEENKIVKDTQKFGVENGSAMNSAVDATNAAAGRFANIDTSGFSSLTSKLWAQIRDLQAAADAVNSIEISGKTGGGSSGGGSSSSGGGVVKSIVSQTISSAYSNAQAFLQKYGLKHAVGGVELAGVPHLVGENGPELYVPSVSGRILDHMATRDILKSSSTINNNNGGNITLHQTINVSGSNTSAGVKVANDFVRTLQKHGINPNRI